MEYLEGLKQLRVVRRESIRELAVQADKLGEEFLDADTRLLKAISEFHQAQRGYRVSEWWQFDWSLPREYSCAIALNGPYLSAWSKEAQGVKKRRIAVDQCPPTLIGKEFRSAISEYREYGTRLNALAEELDLKSTIDRRVIPKSAVMQAFRGDAQSRIHQISDTIEGLAHVLDQLDAAADDALFDFNAIEGNRRRYGSFLARWEVPSRIPAKTFAGPTGPGVFYVAYNRGNRMSAPIRNLYLRVHQRAPRGETPLTKQMIQKSRLGKYTNEYRAAYKKLLFVRSERDSVIERLKALQKRLK